MSANYRLLVQFVSVVTLTAAVAVITPRTNAPHNEMRSFKKSYRFHPTAQIQGEREDGTVGSYNWSGYAALGQNVTEVKGSWIVPTVDCSANSTNHFASFWAGIDGYSSPTVEQTGTDSDCAKGTPSYYAWFEFFPGPSFTLVDFPINPGDSIEAEVSYDPTSQLFTAHLQNVSSGQSFKISSAVPNAKRNSAECIAEAPSNGAGKILPLSQFGAVFFGSNYTGIGKTNDATIDGTSGTLGSFPKVVDLVMVKKDGAIKALPSPLSANGSSFAVTRE